MLLATTLTQSLNAGRWLPKVLLQLTRGTIWRVGQASQVRHEEYISAVKQVLTLESELRNRLLIVRQALVVHSLAS